MIDLKGEVEYVSIGGGVKIPKDVMEKLCKDDEKCKQEMQDMLSELRALRWYFFHSLNQGAHHVVPAANQDHVVRLLEFVNDTHRKALFASGIPPTDETSFDFLEYWKQVTRTVA